jgi:hypothetical protein
MQINIQPGDTVSYLFELPTKHTKWFQGIILEQIHPRHQSTTQRTFKVYFREDGDTCVLRFDDTNHINQWNIISQHVRQPSQQANLHIQAATDNATIALIDAQISLHIKHLGHHPQTSKPEFKNILCKLCVHQKQQSPPKNHAVIYIYAHGLLKYMLGLHLQPTLLYTHKKAKTFITHLKKEFGVCSSCSHSTNFPLIRIDARRFSICSICKTKPGNKIFDIPVCNTCQQLSTNNTNESLLQALIIPMIHLINSSSNTTFNSDAVMKINTTFPGLNRKPDATISFSYIDEHTKNNIHILFIIEIDKKQHATYSDENERTLEFLKSLKNNTTYDKAVMIRLNTDNYLDAKLLSQEAPTIYTRHVILRCWLMYFFINSTKIPPFTSLYLFYNTNSNKLLKLSIDGFIGQTNFAPKNDSDVDNNWIYGIDLTEGQRYDLKSNAYNTWGKYVSSQRVSVNNVFNVPKIIENLWPKWMNKETLLTILINENT